MLFQCQMCSLYCDVCNKPCEDMFFFFFKKDTSGYGSGVDIFFSFLSKFDPRWFLSIKIYLIPMCET